MTEEEQKLWLERSIEIISEKHKELLMKTKSSKAWTAISSNARAVYPVILIFSEYTEGITFESTRRLAKYSGVSLDAFMKALLELKEMRLIASASPSRENLIGDKYYTCCRLYGYLST